jgi:two-component system cell cycle sensor histidine kinase/response regulator CckA
MSDSLSPSVKSPLIPSALATILLVEDEPAIRQLMATALERAGYRVVQAKNGAEALKRFDETVDLLLTDLRMPYVSGNALIAELRQRRHSLKVLAFSAFPAEPLGPGVAFLSKPFLHADLLRAVESVLKG